MSDFKLNFQDTKTAFADKTNAELREKHWLFRMISSPFLVNVGTSLTNFALSIGLPVTGMIKHTFFEQFCGGETIKECEKTIKKLGNSNIGTILDYAVEGKSTAEEFERTKDEIIRTIERAKGDKDIPFAVFKVTGLASFGTLERVSAGSDLSEKYRQKWEKVNTRVLEICEHAHSLEQPIFIDAEESWMQNAVDQLATEMIERFNTEKPIVFNTLQLYRNDRLEFLRESHRKARAGKYILAVKLVRGAYMEKERERAEEMNYPSPIHATKEETDRDYDAAVDYCLENVETIAFVAGTHNEKSVQLLAQKMEEKGLKHDHPHIFYSQLYGMGDNLSYVLAKNDYHVSKYVPYGPVKDTIPYLTRRAEENTSVQGMMSRELELIDKELKRRRIEG
jgi:proline dehydrogenase